MGPKLRAASWARSVSITLKTHVVDLCNLLHLAFMQRYEHPWYNGYDYGLNFNSLRTSTKDIRFSVYPQAKFIWVKPSDRIPDDEPEEDEAPDDGPEEHEATNPNILDIPAAVAGPSQDHSETMLSSPSAGAIPPLGSPDDPPEEIDRVTTWVRRSARIAKAPVAASQPPVSKISTAPSVPEKDNVRYPDFAVMMSTGSLESVHSIWELKAPPAIVTDGERDETLVDSAEYAAALHLVFTHRSYVGQIIQQAQCAFDEYQHQSRMHVVLVAGYWGQHFVMRRNNMPPKDFDYGAATYNDLLKFVKTWPDSRFKLLNPKKTDYSRDFKSLWTKATASVSKDIEKFLSL